MIQKACWNCTVLHEHPIWMVYNPQVFKGSAALRNLGITNVSRIAALENKSFFYIKSSEAMSTYVYYSPPPKYSGLLWLHGAQPLVVAAESIWGQKAEASSCGLVPVHRWVPLPGSACWCSLLLLVQPVASCHAPSTRSWRAASPKDSTEEASIWKFWLSTRGQFVNISCGPCRFPRPAL